MVSYGKMDQTGDLIWGTSLCAFPNTVNQGFKYGLSNSSPNLANMAEQLIIY